MNQHIFAALVYLCARLWAPTNQSSVLSQSDGSTETLSVMDMDEPGEPRHPPASDNLEAIADTDPTMSEVPETQATSSPRRLPSSAGSDPGPDPEELDPQCRSLSMDSAYGTLSPESLRRELQPQPDQSEGEEEEEGELLAAAKGEEDEEEEEDSTSLGSQQSVVQSSKPRRWPRVQPRLHLSRSEDNLLQHFHGENSASHARWLGPGTQGESRPRDTDLTLAHSRSLSELGRNCLEPLASDLHPSGEAPNGSVTAAAPSTVGDGHGRAAPAKEAQTCCSDGEAARNEPAAAESRSGEASPRNRKSPAQQHKKLTLAQLYRIRTTLVLNSTLTAS